MPQNDNFSQVRGYENLQKLTTGHLKCKYLLIWMRTMRKRKKPKNDNFSQVPGLENLHLFRLSGKPLKK